MFDFDSEGRFEAVGPAGIALLVIGVFAGVILPLIVGIVWAVKWINANVVLPPPEVIIPSVGWAALLFAGLKFLLARRRARIRAVKAKFNEATK